MTEPDVLLSHGPARIAVGRRNVAVELRIDEPWNVIGLDGAGEVSAAVLVESPRGVDTFPPDCVRRDGKQIVLDYCIPVIDSRGEWSLQGTLVWSGKQYLTPIWTFEAFAT